jgi:hypothetical protein
MRRTWIVTGGACILAALLGAVTAVQARSIVLWLRLRDLTTRTGQLRTPSIHSAICFNSSSNAPALTRGPSRAKGYCLFRRLSCGAM